jgi:CRP/FNR family cyclic AMP-dependent transcriptional regulator
MTGQTQAQILPDNWLLAGRSPEYRPARDYHRKRYSRSTVDVISITLVGTHAVDEAQALSGHQGVTVRPSMLSCEQRRNDRSIVINSPMTNDIDPPPFYCSLQTHLSNHAQLKRLRTDEVLYTCGTEGRSIYFVKSGCVKLLMLSQQAHQCLLDIYVAGDMVGVSSLLGCERTETVIGMAPSVLHVIPRTEFIKIIFEHQLVDESLQYFAAKLQEQQQVVSHFVTANSEGRLAAALLRLARKLGKPHGKDLLIDEKITQEELGEIVGTTRSRIGYFLKRFQTAGLIERPSRAAILVHEARLDDYIHERL